jgi:hypothetical protein
MVFLLLNVSRSIGASQNGYKIDPAKPYLGSYASDIINLCNIRTLGTLRMLVVKSSTRTDITSIFRAPNLAKGVDSWQCIPHIYDVE